MSAISAIWDCSGASGSSAAWASRDFSADPGLLGLLASAATAHAVAARPMTGPQFATSQLPAAMLAMSVGGQTQGVTLARCNDVPAGEGSSAASVTARM